MKHSDEKTLMWEAATLYYEKKYTQQEIAALMNLSRQTVSKLLNDAIKENIVEIKLHDPKQSCKELEDLLCSRFGLASAVVCTVSGNNNTLRQLMTVKAAAEYITPLLKKGGSKIAVSWGRTINELIGGLPEISTNGNLIFPLFGATDTENSCFSPNEIVRRLADKIGAAAQYAWFPYLTESDQDCILLKKTGYYKKIETLWSKIDIALVGIGNTQIVSMFGSIIGDAPNDIQVSGDIATHFFDRGGTFANASKNTLCASVEDLKSAGQVIAVACGDEKTDAILGALKTGLLNVLMTDEHTARQVLEL